MAVRFGKLQIEKYETRERRLPQICERRSAVKVVQCSLLHKMKFAKHPELAQDMRTPLAYEMMQAKLKKCLQNLSFSALLSLSAVDSF